MTALNIPRCPACGDAWEWPGTEECYSCHEEEAYFNERSNAMIYGEPGEAAYALKDQSGGG